VYIAFIVYNIINMT